MPQNTSTEWNVIESPSAVPRSHGLPVVSFCWKSSQWTVLAAVTTGTVLPSVAVVLVATTSSSSAVVENSIINQHVERYDTVSGAATENYYSWFCPQD